MSQLSALFTVVSAFRKRHRASALSGALTHQELASPDLPQPSSVRFFCDLAVADPSNDAADVWGIQERYAMDWSKPAGQDSKWVSYTLDRHKYPNTGWITNSLAKDGRAFRVTLKGTDRTIFGDEVILSDDGTFKQADFRLALLGMTLAGDTKGYAGRKSEPAVAEALRRWELGDRVSNAYLFEASDGAKLTIRGSGKPVDGALVKLISDVAYPGVNVRYFMADVALGGSLEFYRRIAHSDHEMGCLETVDRIEQGYTIMNLDEFERKRVDGKVAITRKGSDRRISGSEVKLSSDPE